MEKILYNSVYSFLIREISSYENFLYRNVITFNFYASGKANRQR